MDAIALKTFFLFIAPGVISLVVCYLLIQATSRHHIRVVATESKRRHNSNAVPLLGGVGICIGLFFSLMLGTSFGHLTGLGLEPAYLFLALGTALITGICDDIFEITPRSKIAGQLIISFCMLMATRYLPSPPALLFPENPILIHGLSFLWIFGLLNAVNLIDGLDGLASGICMIAIAAMQFTTGSADTLPVTGLAISAIAGFYIWNQHPAKIYLGEAGTLSIACVVFLCSMLYKTNSPPLSNLIGAFLPILILAMDTGLAIIRRVRRGTSIVKGDREHIHHRLQRLGLTHPRSVLLILGITFYFSMTAHEVVVTSHFSLIQFFLLVSSVSLTLLLVQIAENRMRIFLSASTFQILQLMDRETWGKERLQNRLEELGLSSQTVRIFRLQIHGTLSQLIEKSPSRLQTFYLNLYASMTQDKGREVFFESSQTVLVLVASRPTLAMQAPELLLRADLEKLELSERIDLYLDNPSVLQEITYGSLRPALTKVAG